MGLDELHLRVLATSSEDLTEKANAKKGTNLVLHLAFYRSGTDADIVLQLMEKGRHWILVVSLFNALLLQHYPILWIGSSSVQRCPYKDDGSALFQFITSNLAGGQ